MRFYLSNSNLFIGNGDSTGTVKMIEIDNIKSITDKFERLGMLFNKDVPTGYDQMEGKMEFAGPAPDFFSANAFAFETTPLTLLGVMIDSSLSNSANNQQYECDLVVRPSEVGVGKYENQKLTTFERSFKIDSIRIVMAGIEQLAIDTENNIYRVLGVDKWADYRQLLGQ